ncbi:MAG TPA: hypothetical protein VN083_04130 [Vicinamibacteria bacterium]|nr:hypothetical protein [Vicinamibacteria bacterium]
MLRGILGVLAFAGKTPRAHAAGVLSAEAALDAMEAQSEAVEAGLQALTANSRPLARAASSFLADLRRHRQDRARVRKRLGLLPARVDTPSPKAATLADLRAAQQELVSAHAEGIPALENPAAVAVIVLDLVDVARHLAVIDFWIEAEASRE